MREERGPCLNALRFHALAQPESRVGRLNTRPAVCPTKRPRRRSVVNGDVAPRACDGATAIKTYTTLAAI